MLEVSERALPLPVKMSMQQVNVERFYARKIYRAVTVIYETVCGRVVVGDCCKVL